MIISALLISTVLAGVPIRAKVVSSFDECAEFFYRDAEPQGIPQDTRNKKICQQYEHDNFYASLYSVFHRIPLYSAYIFDPSCSRREGQKSGNWFIEPQLSDFQEAEMKLESAYNKEVLKLNQALNGDYSNTGYDRGHLNPNSFQCDDGRNVTFTLTNSVPMDACFNRVHWKQWEESLRSILSGQSEGEGTAYLVTGTVPDQNDRIPKQGMFDDPSSRDFNRVTVPKYIWTAVCYKSNIDDERSFSFGYIGLNQPNSSINVMNVQDLNNKLSSLYNVQAVNIFIDDCFAKTRKSEEMVKKLYMSIQLPFSERLSMSPDILNRIHTAIIQFTDSEQVPSKRPMVTGVTIDVPFDSLETWFEKTESMKYVTSEACVLSQVFTEPIISPSSTGIQKRYTYDDSQELICSLVTEQVAQCTTSCLYKKEARGYYCYSGTEEITCSPTYSIITIEGTKCNSDHTCGTYGYDYYWCYADNTWQYCSPPLPRGIGYGQKYCRSNHNCGKYNILSIGNFWWCYTDYNNNWDYCCSIADPFSALNGKTCNQDHPCGYYSYSYRWCYTTDGSWEYCCTTF